MKEHLNFKPVEGVQVAIVQKNNKLNVSEWYVYIINNNDFPIETVLISTRGYGILNGKEKKTSVLRHLIEFVAKKSFDLIEPIMPDLFQLSNEFWVSYYIDKNIFDKRFVFVAGSINEDNLIDIPLLNMKGILHG